MAAQLDDDAEATDDMLGRPALPAGHPQAWAILVGGTILDGLPWPGWQATGTPTPEIPQICGGSR